MKVTLCDRCGKRTNENILIIPIAASRSKTNVCESYKGHAVDCKDLCEDCYNEYLKWLKEWLSDYEHEK